MKLNQRLTYILPINQGKEENGKLIKIPSLSEKSKRSTQTKPLISFSNQNLNISEERINHPSHRLGVNALAIDLNPHFDSKTNSSGLLYSAGKDGLIISWNLNLPTKSRLQSQKISSDQSLNQLKSNHNYFHSHFSSLEIDRNNLHQVKPTTFRQSRQIHTNWCNDILLCNHNQTLISASSDRTVKAWSPHDPNLFLSPITIGTHDDYVKCLAHSPVSAWVASAGLDRNILLWDITETRPKPLVKFPVKPSSASIYSLATTPTGEILATGSPAEPIGLYDPRSCSQVAKLVGHTDNVRSILLSDDGSRLLSASSDTTIKMWDVRMQRCLHTFSHHSTSVWALHSQHPTLNVFHSGDRSGWLCKVDLEGSDDFGEGECVVLGHVGRHNEQIIDSLHLANEGIVKILALDNAFVWTATGSSTIQRWRDIPTRLERRRDTLALQSSDLRINQPSGLDSTSLSEDQKPFSTTISSNQSASPSTLRSPQSVSFDLNPAPSPIPSLSSSLARDSTKSPPLPIIHPTTTGSSSCPPQFIYIPPNKLDDVPVESLVPLFSPFDNLLHNSDRPDPESVTIHSLKSFSSDSSPHKSPNDILLPSNLRLQDLGRALALTTEAQLTPTARNPLSRLSFPRTPAWRLYTTRDSADQAIPLRDEPDDIIPGCPGLIKSELLNDRRHVITLDTRSRLALWDIVGCTCVGLFDTRDLDLNEDRGSSVGSTASTHSFTANELLKLVKERVEGEATIGTWCTVETQTGLLAVHLDENRCFDAEVYADESGLSPQTMDLMKEDHRLSLGKWTLRNLFDGFITRQAEFRGQNSTAKPLEIQSTGSPNPLHQNRVGLPTENHERSASNDNTEPQQQSSSSTDNAVPPRTPGVTISLAATPTPSELKHVQASHGTMKSSFGPDSVGHLTDYFSLTRVVEADEEKPIPETVLNGPADFSTDASSSYSSSINPPSSPRRASPVPLSSDGHPRLEEKIHRSDSPAPLNPPGSNTSQLTSANIFTRFRALGRGQKRRGSQDPSAPTIISNPISFRDFAHERSRTELNAQQEAVIQRKKLQQQMVQTILSRPFAPIDELDAPRLTSLPEETTILISEEQAETGAWEVSYRGLVATTYEDAELLLDLAPPWLLDFLLGNRVSPAANGLVKVTFVLKPDADPKVVGLPVLANGNVRLTASRALRMRKVASYVIQKLDSSTVKHALKSKQSSQQHLKTTTLSHPEETRDQSSDSQSKSIGQSIFSNGSPKTSHYHEESPLESNLNKPMAQQDSSNEETEYNTAIASKKSLQPCLSPVLVSTPTSNKTTPIKNLNTETIDESQIILSCNGKILPPSVCLGVVKQYFWNQSGDVTINYRLSDDHI